MFWLIKPVFIALLSFSSSLGTKWVSLGNKPWIVRPTFINLNPIKLNYYLFMISLDKCNKSCDAVDNLFTKICVPSKTKDINVKVFDMITRISEAKTMVKHIWCDYICRVNSTCNSNRTWNNETCQCESRL